MKHCINLGHGLVRETFTVCVSSQWLIVYMDTCVTSLYDCPPCLSLNNDADRLDVILIGPVIPGHS